MVTPIARRLEAIERLCRLFERRPRRSWNYKADFGTTRIYLVGRTELTVIYSVHVVPPGHAFGVLTSSVTVWTKGRKRKIPAGGWSTSTRTPGGWNAALLKLDWYRTCQRTVGRYGYKGEWLHSPWGRFGDFWKKHSDVASLLNEVDAIERLSNEAFWGRRRTKR